MKKIIIILLSVFLFSSCFFDSGKKIEKKSLLKDFNQTDFSIKIPSNWEVLKTNDKIFPKPAFGEIVFDAKSPKKVNNFYRNILVLKQSGQNLDSLGFTQGNYIGGLKNYFYSKPIKQENVIIDSKKTKIYIFEAKYSEDTPILTFIQTGIVCKNHYGYLITIALEKGNKNLDRYTKLLGTFKCKDIK